jgi:hypothetical protein
MAAITGIGKNVAHGIDGVTGDKIFRRSLQPFAQTDGRFPAQTS